VSIRVLVVDDHPLMRDGLRFLINAQEDMEVVGEAADGAAALEEVQVLEPDVVIMDIEMPGANGIEVTGRILEAHPQANVVMLSAFPDAAYVRDAVQVGARGYLLKGNAPNEVVRAVRAVMAGHTFMSPEATSALVSAFKDSMANEGAKARPILSQREREVLGFVAEGLRTKEIASRLAIGTKTVDTYRARVMKKLGCGSTAELVRYAIREGLAQA
jgi:DNA-binding NarL/FixJ family response regulator